MAESASTDYSDDALWSQETYQLSNIADQVGLPTLVRVSEGFYGTNDAGTFSQGDLIKLDYCKSMKRVSAYLTEPGSNIRYVQSGQEISLPLLYNGRVRVLPMHGVDHDYHNVDQLIKYFPRYVRVLTRLSFTEPTSRKRRILSVGDCLELKVALRSTKTSTITALKCSKGSEDICLPKALDGVFHVLPDDNELTIREVLDTYRLPQCIRFLGSGVQEIMSQDIKEAIDNIESFSGEMIITKVYDTAPVLFGHYKGVAGDVSSRFCRRSAVIIPLDTPDIASIDVQIPEYMDTDDYELFLLNNFSQSTTTPELLEGALYVAFSKNSQVQFLSTAAPPAIPPRLKSSRSSQPAAKPVPAETVPEAKQKKVPPIPKRKHAVAKPQQVTSPAPVSPPAPAETEYQDYEDGGELTWDIAGALSLGGGEDNGDIYQPPDADSPEHQEHHKADKKGMTKIGKMMKKGFAGLRRKVSDLHVGGTETKPPEPSAAEPQEEEVDDEERVYDYIEEEEIKQLQAHSKKAWPFGETKKDKPVLKVTPVTPVTPMTSSTDSKKPAGQSPTGSQESPETFSKLTIHKLEEVLTACCLNDLAKVCVRERVDGMLFSSLTDEVLRKPPFNLSDFNMQRVKQIQLGWRPHT